MVIIKSLKWVKGIPKHKFIKARIELNAKLSSKPDINGTYLVGRIEQWNDTPKGEWQGYSEFTDEPVFIRGNLSAKKEEMMKAVESFVRNCFTSETLSRDFFSRKSEIRTLSRVAAKLEHKGHFKLARELQNIQGASSTEYKSAKSFIKEINDKLHKEDSMVSLRMFDPKRTFPSIEAFLDVSMTDPYLDPAKYKDRKLPIFPNKKFFKLVESTAKKYGMGISYAGDRSIFTVYKKIGEYSNRK